MKKFILGFITGGIICAAVTGFAVEYAITVNPFPVKVNGVETAIEGYNINDNTYFKLRDVADAVGGFDVGFTDNTITIDTATVCPMSTETPTASSTPTTNTNLNLSPLPELPTETRQGVEYVNCCDIEDMFDSIGLENYKIAGRFFYDENDLANPLISDIPLCENDILLIPLDYYNSTLVPLINSLR